MSKLEPSNEPVLSRRSFLRGNFLSALQSEKTKVQHDSAIRPPWVDLANFLAKCTACQQCVQACETHILINGAGGYPEVDFTQGECTFCQRCAEVCPEPIFRPTTEAAWAHKVEIHNHCLAHNRTECRSCEDNCESRAIVFKRELGDIAKPRVILDACNGCGACLRLCPTQAITIMRSEQCEISIRP